MCNLVWEIVLAIFHNTAQFWCASTSLTKWHSYECLHKVSV